MYIYLYLSTCLSKGASIEVDTREKRKRRRERRGESPAAGGKEEGGSVLIISRGRGEQS